MMSSSKSQRTKRLAELLQRQLADLIQNNIRDPRLPDWVTIAKVTVSVDLSFAKVYFTVLDEDPRQIANILNQTTGYLRHLLAKTSLLRVIPQLRFYNDSSIEYARRLTKLIDHVTPPNEPSDDEPT